MSASDIIWAHLGELELPAISVSSLTLSRTQKFPAQELIGRKPFLQYTGEDAAKPVLNLVYHFQFCNVAEKRQELLEAFEDHQPRMLFLENGSVIGFYVMESLTETFTMTDAAGMLQQWNVTLNLNEFTPDVDSKPDAPAIKEEASSATAADAKQNTSSAKVSKAREAEPKADTAKKVVRQE